MGLDDPENKMSKSATSEKNYISLMDDEKTVAKKIASAVTDSESTIVYNENRKGLANLMTLYSLVSGKTINELETMYQGKGYGDFKNDLAHSLSAHLSPLQEKIQHYLSNEEELKHLLDQGAEKAKKLAEEKMQIIRERIGVNL